MTKKLSSIVLALALLHTASPALAASDAEVEAMAARIKVLEQALNELKQQQQELAERQKAQDAIVAAQIAPEAGKESKKKEEAAPEKHVSVDVGAKGFEVKNNDNNTLMRIRGYGHADFRAFLDDDSNNGNDAFDLRRARLVVEGEIGKFYYILSPDVGGAGAQLMDANAGYKFSDAVDIKIGKFKSPLSLEELRATTDTTFVEDGFPVAMVPSRDIGVQWGGSIAEKTLSYQFAILNGAPDGANITGNDDDNVEAVARVFYEPIKGIGAGIAGSRGVREGTASTPQLPSYRTPGRARFFAYNAASVADGDATRIVPQAYFYRGPFGALAEYAVSSQEVRNGVNSADIRNTGWNAQAAWVLTGEDATYKSVIPDHPFDPHTGQWGAWELDARIGGIDIDDDAFPLFATAATAASEAHNWGFALNGYLNDHVRVTVNYEQTSFDGGGAGGADRETEQAILGRAGVRF